MNFSIATTVSESYRPVADFCLPSWHKNSGADHIDIRYVRESQAATWSDRWYENLIERCRSMQDFVRAAVRSHRPMILMDADCLVLKDLTGGFCDDRPLSVTRWPTINMGVLFLNTTIDWPFIEFIDEFAERAEAHCRAQAKEGHYHSKGGDQDVMWQMMTDLDDDVCKLSWRIWNYMFGVRTTQEQLDQYADAMRVLHIKIATYGCMTEDGCNLDSIQHLRQQFPEAFEL